MTWMQMWAGSWSILTCSYLGVFYYDRLNELIGASFPRSVIIVKEGHSAARRSVEDKHSLGTVLAAKIENDPEIVAEYCTKLKENTDAMLTFLEDHKGKILSLEGYETYLHRLDKYYSAHIFVKYVVDYLSPEQLEKYFPMMEDARLYSEKVLTETESMIVEMSRLVGEKEQIANNLVLCVTDPEFRAYLKGGELPDEKELQRRYKGVALVFDKGTLTLDMDVEAVEKRVTRAISDELQGMSAYKGAVQGKARIVLSPEDTFEEGEILISPMTRPEYLPLMKKAAGFVTNAGGMLCHAAIVARELKKPCVVGTDVATTVFKDGEMIEVDGDKGIVKKVA